MDCRQVREQLFDYLTNRLEGASLAQEIETHTKTCAKCKAEKEELEELLDLLKLAAPPKVSPDFAKKVMERIEQEEKTPFWKNWVPRVSFRPIPAFATILLVLVVLLAYHNFLDPRRGMETRRMGLTIIQPITVTLENPETALPVVQETVRLNGGKVVKEEHLSTGIRLTLDIPPEREANFIQCLKDLWGLEIKKGYKDKEGHIIIFLEKRRLR